MIFAKIRNFNTKVKFFNIYSTVPTLNMLEMSVIEMKWRMSDLTTCVWQKNRIFAFWKTNRICILRN